ncbi:hypothetical protein [Sorangium sp. So ce388]|uniref:hypothetical protein n=1 Tax=Sorangium sp. So ce388 TaxID=3133309 RepID=UPI003F5BD8E6
MKYLSLRWGKADLSHDPIDLLDVRLPPMAPATPVIVRHELAPKLATRALRPTNTPASAAIPYVANVSAAYETPSETLIAAFPYSCSSASTP